MAYVPMERLHVYQRACVLSDAIYECIGKWRTFAQDTLGKQLVRAVDSISANLIEGDARGSSKDTSRFFVYARSSVREARHWINRAQCRGLINQKEAASWIDELEEICKIINKLISLRRSTGGEVTEFFHEYNVTDPMTMDHPTTQQPNHLTT